MKLFALKQKSLKRPGESLERNDGVKEALGDTFDDIEDQGKHEEGDGGEQISNRQEIEENMAEPTEATESNSQHEGDSENLAEYLSMESAQQIKGDADSETQYEKESTADAPKSIEAEDNSITVEERKDEQSLVESEVTCIDQKYEEAVASSEHRESVVEEEVPVTSSLSSSPTAATNKQTTVDEISSSNIDKTRQIMDAPKFDMADELQGSSQEEQPPDDPSRNEILQVCKTDCE